LESLCSKKTKQVLSVFADTEDWGFRGDCVLVKSIHLDALQTQQIERKQLCSDNKDLPSDVYSQVDILTMFHKMFHVGL
jgi:hypothetical protein